MQQCCIRDHIVYGILHVKRHFPININGSPYLSAGLVVDWRHRRLLFSNEDSVTLNGVTYSWQRIESVRLDGSGRRAVVTTDIQQPRGLAIDSTQQSVSETSLNISVNSSMVNVCFTV